MDKKYLVSACLAGEPCRYDGKVCPDPRVIKLVESGEAIPYCPECSGGLDTPRTPAERVGDRVINRDGIDVTENYKKGAEGALEICKRYGIEEAILKSKSPSCGSGLIYDGSFSETLVPGSGVTTELLEQHGIRVMDEKQRSDCG